MTTTSRVLIYLDDNPEPIVDEQLPAELFLDTFDLEDGPHRLIVRAHDQIGRAGYEEIPFNVHNGPGVVVTGLRPGSTRRGRIHCSIDAFSADDPFDPRRAEARSTIPVWVWVMSLFILAWTVWYGATMWEVPTEFANSPTFSSHPVAAVATAPEPATPGAATPGPLPAGGADIAQGKSLFEDTCAACHQSSGEGVPNAFPPLKGNAVANAADPSEHIQVVLFGLSGKAIDGVSYSSAMPPWAAQFSDQQIADIISYERSAWGNHGQPVTAKDVAAIRAKGK